MMNEDKRKGLAREALSIYIAEHHLRSTPERFAVLDKVLEMPSRFTVDELITAMEGGDFRVSRLRSTTRSDYLPKPES